VLEIPRTVRLYGKLGARYGRLHKFVVNSPRDALKALCRMIPGFERELMTSKDRGINYAVFVGSRNIKEKELTYPSGQNDIRIAPVLSGRKAGGLWETIGGIALAAVGAVSMYFGNPYGGQMMLMGAALAFGGISQMISAHSAQSNTNQPSYYFGGAQNTTSQGGPVPLLYGRMLIGSTVISSGINATDQ
jgi:predicted phage tail protein